MRLAGLQVCVCGWGGGGEGGGGGEITDLKIILRSVVERGNLPGRGVGGRWGVGGIPFCRFSYRRFPFGRM